MPRKKLIQPEKPQDPGYFQVNAKSRKFKDWNPNGQSRFIQSNRGFM